MASDGPELGDLMSMGAGIAGCLVVGFGVGWLADRALGLFPVLALVGLALGIVAACFYTYAQFRKYL